MKKLTVAFSITVAILLIGGCGDNGGSSSDKKGAGSSQNSNGSTSSQSGDTSQQLTNLISSVDAQNGLDGYTVLITDPTNITPNFKEDYFVFTEGNKVKFVENRDNGNQFVYDGTYEVKTTIGFGNIINISYKNGDIDSSTMIELDDSYHVKPKQLTKFPATVYSNDNNGLVIKDNTPATGTNVLTVTSPDDVKGYTIISNEADAGSGAFTTTQTITIKFDCDGTFTQTIKTALSGQPANTDENSGDNISVDGDELTYGGESIPLDSNHQIVGGKTCFMGSTGTGEECANNLYVKTITQHDTCQ